MTRARNWERAARDRERAAAFRAAREAKLGQTQRERKPPTARQLRYLASLAAQLGRDCPEASTRGAASALIAQFKNLLATTGK